MFAKQTKAKIDQMNDAQDFETDEDVLLLRASAKRLFESLMEQTPDRIYIKDRKAASSRSVVRWQACMASSRATNLRD